MSSATAGGIPAIGDPGRAALEVGPGAPVRHPDSADHELSECAVPGAQVRAASVRGLLHRHRSQPRQDRYSVVYDEASALLVVTVCDGVGQFSLSHEAAGFVAAAAPRAYLDQGDWNLAVGEVNERLGRFAAEAPERSRLDQAPADARMATTLAGAAIGLAPGQRKASIAWTDDTSIWLLNSGEWTNLTPDPLDDDAAGVHTGRVRALPSAEPRVFVAEVPAETGALFVLTDGIGVPLEGARQVRETLAEWWAEPPDVFTFARQVGFARRGHMDDRTAVGVWFSPL
ncbi:protein phosphatase 2C domain-containing protein [Frankia sp. Cj3]|uniref:protein phosphatase 2C domain-containing protein n=1 Tax=Frankia sp. Cj3 TaxID=2880976 RepID=UPI001EF5EB02|nr:protein phosphatase 2C domain-containing protein [Frankia sp. Cj3]